MTELVHSSEFFLFDFPWVAEDGEERIAVAFCSGQFDERRFIERVRRHFDHRLPPDRLILIGDPRLTHSLATAAASDMVIKNLPAATRFVHTPAVIPVSFDEFGNLIPLDPALVDLITPALSEALKAFGLKHIFMARHGILDAGAGRHFIKPSEKHSQHFIRTANVLLYSAEVGFIAFALLKWLPLGTRQILTDTASINAVAYSLVDLRRCIRPDEPVPTVNSFSSYGGLETFRAEGEEDTLCLVSASTSGDLEAKVAKQLRLPLERVVTLFFCGAASSDGGRVLSDVTERKPGDGGWPAIQSFAEENCPLCAQGSTRVRISGDQFLPSDPRVDSVLLTVTRVPSWIANTMRVLVGTRAISCHHRRSGTTGHIRQIHLSMAETVTAASELRRRLDRVMQSSIPAALRAVIYLPDESSRRMAELVADYYAKHTSQSLPDDAIVSSQSFTTDPSQLAKPEGAIVVVASTTVTGRSLLGVSQLLRQVMPGGSIVYIVGVARSSTRREWEELCKNLRYGQYADEFPLHSLYLVTLPDDRETEGSPWEQERQLLVGLKERLVLVPGQEVATKVVLERVDQINAAEQLSKLGLQDDCFLPAWGGSNDYNFTTAHLRLRPGFAFWPFKYDVDTVTQADAYATILGVLHHLRHGEGSSPYLVQHEHARTVLSPGNFTRFNDGVIQASLLRGAKRAELDYSHDDRLSAQMRDIVLVTLRNLTRAEGEAGPEFLLALALGKLRLTNKHLTEIQIKLQTMPLHPFLAALAGEIGKGRDWA